MKKEKCSFIDFSKFEIDRKIVSVNGKDLPIAIGDKILVNDDDNLVKTVMGIHVSEDSRINYYLEWFDAVENTFKNERVDSN